ncbi:hypothetical protein ABFA07_012200 [Porites harrisoni]
MTVCPKHRDAHGIRWRTGKTKCCVPTEVAGHKTTSNRGDRGLDSKQSYFISQETGLLVPAGSPICRRCREHIGKAIASREDSEKPSESSASRLVNQQYPASEVFVEPPTEVVELPTEPVELPLEKEESSTEDIADHMKRLSIDESYVLASSERTSTASSLDGEVVPGGGSKPLRLP